MHVALMPFERGPEIMLTGKISHAQFLIFQK